MRQNKNELTEIQIHSDPAEEIAENIDRAWKDGTLADCSKEAIRETFAAGIPICYSDEDSQGEDELIMEYPDGRRKLFKTSWEDNKYSKKFVKDLKSNKNPYLKT